MKSREYFKKNYQANHINHVVSMHDYTSLYSLIDEYADFKIKKYEDLISHINIFESSEEIHNKISDFRNE